MDGYRQMPVVRDNPQWWILELLDGFGAHTNSHPASKYRYDNKVLSLKEEGDSSSINQAYDKDVAKSDKSVQRKSLNYLRQATQFNSNITDQWGLMLTGCAAVRHTRDNPQIWDGSFEATNTHPLKQIPFHEWCKKIERFMQAADSFDLTKQDSIDIDTYTLTPSWWQAMSSELKTLAVQIVKDAGDNAWGYDCVMRLHQELSVKISEIPALQPCIFLAIENPSHLTRGLIEEDEEVEEEEDDDEVVKGREIIEEVEGTRAKANEGLSMWTRLPPGLSNEEAFIHMIEYRQRRYAKKKEQHKISDSLLVSPRNHHQRSLMGIRYDLEMQGNLMEDVHEGVPLEKAAQVRLDNLAQIKSRTQFINDPERLQRLKHRLEMMKSIGAMEAAGKKEAAKKKDEENQKLEELLPDAIRMYVAGETEKRGFTKAHIRTILVFVYDVPTANSSDSLKKGDLMDTLKKEVENEPDLMATAVLTYTDKVQPEAAGPPPLPVEAAEISAELGTAELDAEPAVEPPAPAEAAAPAAASLSNPIATWLMNKCDELKHRIGTSKSTLELAIIAVNLVKKWKDMETSPVYSDKQYDINHYKGMVRTAFRSRDIGNKSITDEFVNLMVNKRVELIVGGEDEFITEREMRKLAPHFGGF